MARGWSAHVYRTDLDKEAYAGFFLDVSEAEGWIKKQTEGTYEVSDEPPSKRIPSAEEADHELHPPTAGTDPAGEQNAGADQAPEGD